MKKYVINNIFLILCSLLFLFWIIFQIVNPKSLSTGDTASNLFLYSKLISDKFTLLSQDYYYPTELRFLHATTVYSIFCNIFNNFDYVRLFSNITMYIMILLSYIYIIKQYHIENKYAFLAMFLFLIPISNHYLYIGIISSFYLIYYAVYIMYFALLLKIVDTSSKKWLYITIYSLLILIVSLNGIRVLIHIFVPLVCASILMFLLYKLIYKKNIKESINYMIYSFLGLIISFIGYIISEKILRNLVSFSSFTQSKLYNYEISKKNIDKFIYNIQDIFSIFEYSDIITLISNVMIYIAVILFFYIIYYLLKHEKNIRFHFLLIFLLVAFIEQIFTAYVFREYRTRYTYQIMIFIPIIIAVYASLSKYIKKQNIIFAIFLVSLIIHGGIVIYYTFGGHYKLTSRYYVPNKISDYKNVITYLNDNNLKFGYVDHWNGQLIYEITNGEIEAAVTRISKSKCQFSARKFDTLVRYFNDTDLKKKAYLLVSNKVNDICKEKNMLLKENEHKYRDKNYTVYILEKGELLKNLK